MWTTRRSYLIAFFSVSLSFHIPLIFIVIVVWAFWFWCSIVLELIRHAKIDTRNRATTRVLLTCAGSARRAPTVFFRSIRFGCLSIKAPNIEQHTAKIFKSGKASEIRHTQKSIMQTRLPHIIILAVRIYHSRSHSPTGRRSTEDLSWVVLFSTLAVAWVHLLRRRPSPIPPCGVESIQI